MRRQRGFTLMEILIAMALTSILTTSVLAIVRTQLSALEMNDQMVRTQQSTRAAMDYVETIVRRACGGVSGGSVGLNIPNVPTQTTTCLRYIDRADVTATAFTPGSTTNSADAIEVIYATGTMTALTTGVTIGTTVPTLSVYDVSQFSAGDYILVGDNSTAWMFQIDTLTPPGTITLKAPSGTLAAPTPAPSLKQDSPVFKAASYSFFIGPSTGAAHADTYANMLLVDPNGVTSTNHLDYGIGVQPAVEGVLDFQVAVGADSNSDGTMDQWYGPAGETLPPLPWGAGLSNLKQVRLSLVLQTLNSYAGAPPTIPRYENHPAWPTVPAGLSQPRYRSASMIVAPRAWNLTE